MLLRLFRTDVLAARKRLSPWSAFASWCGVGFTALAGLYAATAQRPGLVHAVMGTPTLQGDLYCVDLTPLGLQSSSALPGTEDEARLMLHGLLHGLAAIHEVCLCVGGWMGVNARAAGGASNCGSMRARQ